MGVVLTIGYEGATIEDFVATLRAAMVDVLIDIRDFPVSRKRGFSKRPLADAVRTAGLDYVHLRDLGDPKTGREAARRGDTDEFERIFRAHLSQDSSQEALTSAIEIARSARACLLCFERNHACCHRLIVAEAMAERGQFDLQHLGVRAGLAVETDGEHEHAARAFAIG